MRVLYEPLPKGVVKGRDGMIFPIQSNWGVACNVVVQRFEADRNFIHWYLEVIVPLAVGLLGVDGHPKKVVKWITGVTF